jgi:adenylate cyclase
VRKAFAGLLVGGAAAALVVVADVLLTVFNGGGAHPLETVELKTYDWRLSHTARPETARTDIALIEIDEYSLRNLQANAGRWPWPRAVHSMLIDYLARAPAKVIAYDVNFAEADTRRGFDFGDTTWSGSESDKALADSIKAAGNVLLLADATFDSEAKDPQPLPDFGYRLNSPKLVERRTVFLPFPALAGAAAGFGHNLFVLDSDGPIRHSVPFVRSGARAIPLLGAAAALRVAGIPPAAVTLERGRLTMGDRVLPMSSRRVSTSDGPVAYLWSLIAFRGPAVLDDMKTRTYPTYSFFDLEYSEEQLLAKVTPKIDPAVFRDKIVFVGTSATGLLDVFETPFAHGKMPGIQIHAAVADDILSKRFIDQPAAPIRVASVVAAGLVIGLAATVLPAWWAALVTVVFVALTGWLATQLFAGGYWVNLSQPVLASWFALLGGVGYQYFFEDREKRKVKKLFGQYVSKDVYAQLVENPTLARLGGHRREMTVLFSDIRGFTTLTERGQPDEVVGMLNEYFSSMVDLVFRHKGTLDKFVGDMVMALYGAPLDDPDHADHAVQTALAMIAELSRLNAQWKVQGRFAELDIGIGINTGPMIAGNIGSEAIMSYTVIGDAVNLGSRLESLNKQYGTRIIISEATRERLKGQYQFRALGDVVVKGKTQPVAIFEVVGPAASPAPGMNKEASV